MKKLMRRGLCETIVRGVTFVLMMVILSTSSKAYAVSGDIANANINSISKWEAGYIDEKTGANVENKKRIRTTDYYALSEGNYDVSVTGGSDYVINAFYYDADKKFVSTEKLYDGSIVEVTGSRKYVKLDVRKITSEKSMSLGQFGAVLGKSLKVTFSVKVQHESSLAEIMGEDSYHELFTELNATSIKGWTAAGMNSKTGEVTVNKRRLVTEKMYPIYDQTISVAFSESGYKVEVYEYDENEKFIKMTVASNGTDVEVSEKTRFVRFSLYRTTNEKSLSLGQWSAIFSSGLKLSVSADEGETYEVVNGPVNKGEVQEPVEIVDTQSAIYKELLTMLKTGDKSVHDISKYKIDIYELRDIYAKIKDGEGHYYCANASQMYLGNFSLKNNVCYTMQLVGMDSDFLNRYNRMMKSLNEMKSMVTSKMTDLDKVILVHEYLIEHTYYEKTSTNKGCTGGLLGDGHGLCAGYANAFNDAMRFLGIESKYIASDEMNHAWSLVKIDGQYYHVDTTWDESLEESNGYIAHNYLLASDKRFATSIPRKHYNWAVTENNISGSAKIPATSTKFDSWFVHDVKGKMFYYNGYWYYTDGKTVKKSDAYGTKTSTVLTESSNVSIISLSQGKLQYKVNGSIKTKSVN